LSALKAWSEDLTGPFVNFLTTIFASTSGLRMRGEAAYAFVHISTNILQWVKP